MRILLIAVLASLAGCASSPQTSDPGNEAATLATPAVAPSPAAQPAAPTASEAPAEFKPPAGYKAKVENGRTMYCRRTTVLGSRFAKDVCMTEAQLRDFQLSNEGMRSNKDQTSRVCAGGGACQNQ